MVKFHLINKSGLALDIKGGATTSNGSPVIVWPFHGDTNQQWDLDQHGNNFSICCSSQSEKFALDLDCNEMKLIMWEYHGENNQKWFLEEASPGYYQLVSAKFPNLSLAGSENLETIAAVPCGTCDNQLWRLVPAAFQQFPLLSSEELSMYSLEFVDLESKIQKILSTYGFCIVNNVLTDEEITSACSAMGSDLLEVCDKVQLSQRSIPHPVKTVWRELQQAAVGEVPRLFPGRHIDASAHSLPHGRFAWSLRLNERVRRLYEVLHALDRSELVVGLDQPFYKPSAARSSSRTDIWPHADFNANIEATQYWTVYQSVAYLWPVQDDKVSATVVWPGSHTTAFQTLMSHSEAKNKSHYVLLDNLLMPNESNDSCSLAEGRWLNEQCLQQMRRVPMRAGSVLLWDSRLIHQGWNSGPRLAMPVCWEPRSRRTRQVRNRKLRLCAQGLPSTHWASLGKQHNITLRDAHQSSAMNWNGNEKELRLPLVSSIFPACLIAPSSSSATCSPEHTHAACSELHNTILALCQKLGDSDDMCNELADTLESYMLPAVAAVL